MWENRRTKSKKDPLLDISCKLSTLLKGKIYINNDHKNLT